MSSIGAEIEVSVRKKVVTYNLTLNAVCVCMCVGIFIDGFCVLTFYNKNNVDLWSRGNLLDCITPC